MNLEKYNDTYMSIFNVTEDALNEDFNFGTAPGWNSFAHMELIASLEDAFEIMFEVNDIMHFGGYENGKAILRRYGVDI